MTKTPIPTDIPMVRPSERISRLAMKCLYALSLCLSVFGTVVPPREPQVDEVIQMYTPESFAKRTGDEVGIITNLSCSCQTAEGVLIRLRAVGMPGVLSSSWKICGIRALGSSSSSIRTMLQRNQEIIATKMIAIVRATPSTPQPCVDMWCRRYIRACAKVGNVTPHTC